MHFSLAQKLLILSLLFTNLVAASLSDIAARQIAAITGSSTSSGRPASITDSAIAPCCVIWPGFNGVLVNSWYTERVTQYTATVITTVLQYRDAAVTANSTTIYLPKNLTFTEFGYYGGPNIMGPFVSSLTAVPTDLVPSGLLAVYEYGGTTVVRSNETGATWLGEDLSIASPTPYAVYHNIEIATYTPDYENIASMTAPQTAYDRALCGTSTVESWLSYVSGSWAYIGTSAFIPPLSTRSAMRAGRLYGFEQFVRAIPLPAPLPNELVWVDLPEGVSSSLVANQTLRSMYPWITNCLTYGGIGEPTVHVAVDDLTTKVMSTITIDANLGAQRSPPPTPLPSTSLIAVTIAHVEQTSLRLQVPTSAASPPAAVDMPSIDVSWGPPVISTFSSTTLPAQKIGSSAIAIGSTILSVGGDPLTTNGAIISLITQSGTLAMVIDGTTTQAFPASFATGQGIALGNKIVTVAPPAPTELIIGGVTLKSGEATVISGQTVSLAGTNVIIASGDVKTTQDIGGIIMNGLGVSNSSSKSSTRYTGTAIGVRLSTWQLSATWLVSLWRFVLS